MKAKKDAEELTLLDRFLFSEAIEDEVFAENMMSIIFDNKYRVKTVPMAEKEIRNVHLQKFIRLDAYLKVYVYETECPGTILNTEVQQQNKRDLPKRTRYYISMIDANQLGSGETDYNKMENVCIVVISPFDVAKNGKYWNRFTTKSDDKEHIELEDGIERIFLNTRGNDPESISHELRWMLRYFEETTEEIARKSGSRRIMEMSECVEKIRKGPLFDLKLIREMEAREDARIEARAEGLAEGRAEGRAEGLMEAHMADATGLKAEGVPVEIIHRVTGLPMETIAAL